MNTYSMKSNHHPTAWILAMTLLLLAVTLAVIVAAYPADQDTQIHQPDNAQPIPTPQTDSNQVECQALPECGWIRRCGKVYLASDGRDHDQAILRSNPDR